MTDLLTENEMAAIRQIVMAQLDVKPEQVTPEADLKADLSADSLDLAEIAMKLEEQFNVVAPDEKFERLDTVGDLYDIAAELLGRIR